jgi:hypothetical protein
MKACNYLTFVIWIILAILLYSKGGQVASNLLISAFVIVTIASALVLWNIYSSKKK